MSIFGKPKAGGFMDEIRCDEPNYLIWKWHPVGSELGNNNRENAIRWGSSLRVKDGEVAVFVYKQDNGIMEDFIAGPFDETIKTKLISLLYSCFYYNCMLFIRILLLMQTILHSKVMPISRLFC